MCMLNNNNSKRKCTDRLHNLLSFLAFRAPFFALSLSLSLSSCLMGLVEKCPTLLGRRWRTETSRTGAPVRRRPHLVGVQGHPPERTSNTSHFIGLSIWALQGVRVGPGPRRRQARKARAQQQRRRRQNESTPRAVAVFVLCTEENRPCSLEILFVHSSPPSPSISHFLPPPFVVSGLILQPK